MTNGAERRRGRITRPHRYDAGVRCRSRLLFALTPAVLALLIAVSPATGARGDAHRSGADTTTIRDVESSLAGLSAGIAERVPIPTIGPTYGAAATGVAAAASLSWIALLFAAAIALSRVGLTRRDRAPPRRYRLLPA